MNAYVFGEWDHRKIQHETHTHLWTNSSLNQAHNHEIILKKIEIRSTAVIPNLSEFCIDLQMNLIKQYLVLKSISTSDLKFESLGGPNELVWSKCVSQTNIWEPLNLYDSC